MYPATTEMRIPSRADTVRIREAGKQILEVYEDGRLIGQIRSFKDIVMNAPRQATPFPMKHRGVYWSCRQTEDQGFRGKHMTRRAAVEFLLESSG